MKRSLVAALLLSSTSALAQEEPNFVGTAAPATSAATTPLTLQVKPGLEVFAQYAYRRTLDESGKSQWFHQFEGGLKRSRYLAIVRGHTTDSGVIDKALAEPEDPRLSSPIRPYRPACTHFTTLARTELPFAVDRYPTSRYSLLMIEPETGRRHQIRRHLKHLSHPIVGDTTYGKGRHNRFVADHFGVRRLLLACIELTVAHPDDGRLLTLVAPPGDAFGALLAQLGWADVLAARWHGGNEPQAGARGLESDHLRRKMEDCEESPGTPR